MIGLYLTIGGLLLIFGGGMITMWFEGLSERPERRDSRKYTFHTGKVGKGLRNEKPIDTL